MTEPARIHIVGCGRSAMGDDQAGLVVAQRLAERCLPGVTVVTTEEPVTVLADEEMRWVDLLVVVDAAMADDRHPVGSSERLGYRHRPEALRPKPPVDTHALGVDAGLALASALNLLPPEVWIYVLFGGRFDRALTMGDQAAAGVDPLVERIERDIRSRVEARACTSCRL